MSNINLNKVYTSLASRGMKPQVDVQAFSKVDERSFKVVAATHSVASEADFSAAVAELTGGKGRVIPGSFNRRGDACSAIVAANAISKPMDASFHQITASVASAADGTIWRVVDDNGSKRVVLESCDDLADILAARKAGRATHMNPHEGAGLDVASFQNGDLVRFVNVATQTTSWGLAFRTEAGVSVVGENLEPVSVPQLAVVASVPRERLGDVTAKVVSPYEANAKLDPAKLNDILSYLKKAWAPGAMTDAMLERYRQLADKAA